MISPLEDDILATAEMGNDGQYHIMTSQNSHQAWPEGSIGYKTSNVEADTMSYHSFNWGPVDDVDGQFTPPPHSTTKNSASSFDFVPTPDMMSNPGYLPYQDNEAFMDPSQYMSTAYASAHSGSGLQQSDRLRLPGHRTRPSRNISSHKQESPTASNTGLEVPRKPKLNRRYSDQSATSLQSNSNSTTERNPTSAPASNEAHIIAERRYRNNLNAKIAQIQSALQDARFRSHSNESYRSRGGTYFNTEAGSHDMDDTSPASSGGKDRRRKADILDEAAEYIRFADLELRHLSEEVQYLNQALAASQGRAYDPQHRHRG